MTTSKMTMTMTCNDNDECKYRVTLPGDIIGYLEGGVGGFLISESDTLDDGM